MQLGALNKHLTFNNLFVSLRGYSEWDIGVFCAQKDSAEKFACPFDSMQKKADSWYDSLVLYAF